CAHFLYHYREHRDLHSFPTRRSSDLRIADETIAAKRTLIGSDVKVSKVAQVLAAVRNGILADRFIRFIFAVCTNFTNLTTWCYRVIYYRYEASYYDFSRCSSQGHGRLLAITRGSSLAHDRHAGGFARVPARTRISEGISAVEDHTSEERERAQRRQSEPRPVFDGH